MTEFLIVDTCAIIHLMYINSFDLLERLGYCAITTIAIEQEFKNALASGNVQSHNFFFDLHENKKISIYPLAIEDLVEMTNIKKSKKASIADAELSCIVVGKRLNCKVMTDDNKAVKYIKQYLSMSQIVTIVDLLLEAYIQYFLGDDDLRRIQETLKNNRYNIKMDLVVEGARRRLIKGNRDTIN